MKAGESGRSEGGGGDDAEEGRETATQRLRVQRDEVNEASDEGVLVRGCSKGVVHISQLEKTTEG